MECKPVIVCLLVMLFSYICTGMTREKLKELAIGLALNCLSFDFLGIETDDSAEDVVLF